ncbi:MAG TPA: hypothetical protein VFQ35_20845 [Polyangiaceae bacterium]|nr:hypothetical protein [Polyangiaceae bacterium]
MRTLGLSVLLVACAPAAPAPPSAPVPRSSAAPVATTPGAAATPTPAAPVTSAPSSGAATPSAKPCGELACLEFPSAEGAFERVLSEEPRVLAVGEAHAQKGSETVASTAKRFGEQLLPLVRGRASDIVIELLLANGSCGKKTEERVAEKQKPVTENQAATNQNEFVELGTIAKKQGTMPHALTPTCDEFAAISSAGDDVVDRMLTTVAAASTRNLEALLKQRPPSALLLAYGGALHNDLAPRPGRERWSFGPHFSEVTGGKYVELDLIVPEYVKDTETWRAFPWYSAYAHAPASHGALLYTVAPHSFVLIFPRST